MNGLGSDMGPPVSTPSTPPYNRPGFYRTQPSLEPNNIGKNRSEIKIRSNRKLRQGRKQGKNRSNYVMYVIRVSSASSTSDQAMPVMRNSRPCNHCIELMRGAGVTKVYYSTDAGTLMKEKVAEMEHCHLSYGTRLLAQTRTYQK